MFCLIFIVVSEDDSILYKAADINTNMYMGMVNVLFALIKIVKI